MLVGFCIIAKGSERKAKNFVKSMLNVLPAAIFVGG
jgi:hypothetical protein